jgi:chemotaxis protein methyltransferase WspC
LSRAESPAYKDPHNLLDELAATAAATAGMQPTMLDRRNLKQTLKRRIEATKQNSPEAYLDLYRLSPEEQSIFLEGILNGETSFFRDATVFAELARWTTAWFAINTRPMRILSAPCSTGEEPYSLAVLLEQAGIPFDRFSIDALDLSASAIEQAQTAIYTGLSLRNIPQPENAGFLERVAKGWRVKQPLRSHVQFRQANLLDANVLEPHAYDLICSRNLMIYQTAEARRSMARALAGALVPGGRLVLGAADWGRDLDEFFRLEEPVNSFALRLREPEVSKPQNPENQAPQLTTNPPQVTTNRTTRNTTKIAIRASEQLADVTALYRNALEAYLRAEEREAERLCRQTLYLEGDHLPSLELLAKIQRPHASGRVQLALHARLKRHRLAAEGSAP